ncbi:ATP-binding cassette domain-containing protein [Martelella mediterranea]|uniref:ATP-binding cassette domain-containing protein n=1 Tax=Martelella mediterranea TaxID=293089 RepID=UPI001E42CF82|nr:ATP-binding cassette domain-containing protein [Martelella mediterranea]MCD1635807.1 ATP-binding cassette domain-containing protein [Martelella mediterranea]
MTLHLDQAPLALECRNIRKEFPGVLALSDVSLQVRRGEIHALLGQNGAGKSTLVKVLTGVYQHDGGEILVEGKPVRMSRASEAEANGIVIVHQDQQLVAQFDVTRNVFLGIERTRGAGFLNLPEMRAETEKALAKVGAAFTPDTLVRDLSVAQREQVAIAAALVRDPKILILDEPTASLSEAEVNLLFGVIRGLRDDGVTIVYISHYLDEVLDLVDRMTVLRDGRLIATKEVGETSRPDLIKMMVGREISQLYPKEDVAIGETALSIRDLAVGNAVRGVDLDIRSGEIFGLAGLMGAGRSELALALIGAMKRTRGTVTLNGKPSNPSSPKAAKNEGYALIPEDRRHDGLIGELSMRENMTLPNISKWATFGLLNLGREKADAQQLQRDLAIQPPNIATTTKNLSGGNQQKVVIGRWLPGNAEVFIFDEPTTGVDVGSKVEIYRQMTALARRGAVVILISSDFEEIVGMCDRAAVMQKGRINAVLERDELDVATVLFHASGADGDAENSSTGHKAAPPAEVEMREHHESGLGRFFARWGSLFGMAVAIAVIAFLSPQFLNPGNIFDVLKQGSVLAFIALGLTLVLIAGGLDVSAGAISQFSSNVAAGLIVGSAGTAVALGAGIAIGAVVGLINAALVLIFAMPPFVATLGMMFVTMGATLLYNGGQAITLSNEPGFFLLGQGYVGPVPVVFILLVAITFVLHIFLSRSRMGLRMYAVGQNLAAAELRGIRQPRYALASFIIGGAVLGFAGVVLTSYSYGASALATGIDFLISALAAAFLGSTLSRSGQLNVTGTVVAAMFLASLSNGLILIGISNQVLPAIQGAVLILSIAIGVIRRREIGQVLLF